MLAGIFSNTSLFHLCLVDMLSQIAILIVTAPFCAVLVHKLHTIGLNLEERGYNYFDLHSLMVGHLFGGVRNSYYPCTTFLVSYLITL